MSSVQAPPALLVPIEVRALGVPGSTTQGWANCVTTVSDGAPVWTAPFTNLETPRPLGVYLHWALPDALTAAISNGADGLALPPIPDRWVVLRIYTSPSQQQIRSVAGWVLETDGATPVVSQLDGWTEPGPTGSAPWTATGPGDPSWSAYYDNVVNRLAFYDPLTDLLDAVDASIDEVSLEEQTIAYLVCGWYADLTQDPLAQIPAGEDPATWMVGALGWNLAGSGPVDVAMIELRHRPENVPQPPPMRTICHGAVVDLPILFGGTENDGVPAASSLHVVLGSSLTEAMAAALSQEGLTGADRLVEAFQLGMLDALDDADGLVKIETGLHARQFASAPGGSVTSVVPRSLIEKKAHRASRAVEQTAQIATTELGPLASLIAEHGLGVPDWSQIVGEGTFFGELMQRTLPPFRGPQDPVLLVNGGGRSFKHGYDGRFNTDGTLSVRQESDCINEMGAQTTPNDPSSPRAWVYPSAMLGQYTVGSAVPTAVQALLEECVCLDPGSAIAAAWAAFATGWVTDEPGPFDALVAQFEIEQTAWWALRQAASDPAVIKSYTGMVGNLPSPIAITPANPPWDPRHLEWEIEVASSPRGLVDWLPLGDVDYETPSVIADPAQASSPTATLRGRAVLTGGAATALAAAAASALSAVQAAGSSQSVSQDPQAAPSAVSSELMTQIVGSSDDGQAAELIELIADLETLDVIAGNIHGFHEQLAASDAQQALAQPGLRAGFARVTRLRLVDCFGRYVDLVGGAATASPSIAMSETMSVTGVDGLAGLAPRWFADARLWLQYTNANGSGALSTNPLPGADPSAVRPVCGFVLPNHLDGTLDFYGADGADAGRVANDPTQGTVWQNPPGETQEATTDLSTALPNAQLRAIAEALLDQGTVQHTTGGTFPAGDDPLSALLRTVDSTRWTVDPFGHSGEDHLSLLLGHPVAVLRALIRIDFGEKSAEYPLPVPVRLGSLANWQDGLLGFYLDSDPGILHAVHPAAAQYGRAVGPGQGFLGAIDSTAGYARQSAAQLAAGGASGPDLPVDHPSVDSSGIVWVTPGTNVWLTLLVEPYCTVHATSGVLPQAELGMMREWMTPALEAMVASFRFGPVLIDPSAVRMPLSTDISGQWTWEYLSDPATWASAPIANADDTATLSGATRRLSEGWLVFTPPAE